MSETHQRIAGLSHQRVADLLEVLIEDTAEHSRGFMGELQRLAQLPSKQLAQTTEQNLLACGLQLDDIAALLGISHLTAKRWFEFPQSLNDLVKLKLAGVCLLLSTAKRDHGPRQVRMLVTTAVSMVRGNGAKANPPSDDALDMVCHLFDAAALMGVALYLLLDSNQADPGDEVGTA